MQHKEDMLAQIVFLITLHNIFKNFARAFGARIYDYIIFLMIN